MIAQFYQKYWKAFFYQLNRDYNKNHTYKEYTELMKAQNQQLDNIFILKSQSSNQDDLDEFLEGDLVIRQNVEALKEQIQSKLKIQIEILKLLHSSSISEVYLISMTEQRGISRKILKIGQNGQKQAQIIHKTQSLSEHIVHIKQCGQNWIIMDSYQANLGKLISKNYVLGLSPQIIAKMLIQISSALQVLHQCGYVHADLKSSNILFNIKQQQYAFYLCDFGNSLLKSSTNFPPTQTLQYRAPQIFQQQESNKQIQIELEKIDSWGLGCILFECVSGQSLLPQIQLNQFDQEGQQHIIRNIYKQYIDKDEIAKRIKRLSVPENQIKFESLIMKLLEINPQMRMSVREVSQILKKQQN